MKYFLMLQTRKNAFRRLKVDTAFEESLPTLHVTLRITAKSARTIWKIEFICGLPQLSELERWIFTTAAVH